MTESRRTGSRRGYTQEEVAHMLLAALEHPHDPPLIDNAKMMMAAAKNEREDSQRGRQFRNIVLLIEATTLSTTLKGGKP